jgi:hypothetical protein
MNEQMMGKITYRRMTLRKLAAPPTQIRQVSFRGNEARGRSKRLCLSYLIITRRGMQKITVVLRLPQRTCPLTFRGKRAEKAEMVWVVAGLTSLFARWLGGSLKHSGWLVPIGKEMVEGEVERGRHDERHRLRGQRGHLKNQV